MAESLFKMAYGPLVAYYFVDEERRRVEISRFWRPNQSHPTGEQTPLMLGDHEVAPFASPISARRLRRRQT